MLIPKLEPYIHRIKLDKLQPGTVYLVYMTAVYDELYSNKSNNVTFTTVYGRCNQLFFYVRSDLTRGHLS